MHTTPLNDLPSVPSARPSNSINRCSLIYEPCIHSSPYAHIKNIYFCIYIWKFYFSNYKKKITLEAAQRWCKGCSRSGPIVKIFLFHSSLWKKNFLLIKIFFKNFCTRLRSTIYLQSPKRDFRIISKDALSYTSNVYTQVPMRI